MTHQWGAAAYPLRYVYDAYGQMEELHTWRGDNPSLWSGSSLPGAFGSEAAEVTAWVRHAATGLLLEKLDAAGRGAAYAYQATGLLHTRTWERGVVTTYAHNAAGELTGAAYSDGTPGFARAYRRDGALAGIADAAGTTAFAFTNPGGTAGGESIAGGLLDGVSLEYPGSADGRREGFTARLGGSIISEVSYGYDNLGRLEEVADDLRGIGAAYGYAEDSDLVETVALSSGAGAILTGTRAYDSRPTNRRETDKHGVFARRVKTRRMSVFINIGRLASIGWAKPGPQTVTSHAYTYDAAHCPSASRNDLESRFALLRIRLSAVAPCQWRTRADREDGAYWLYNRGDWRAPRWIPRQRNPKGETSVGRERVNYNDRGEVTGAAKHLSGGAPLAG